MSSASNTAAWKTAAGSLVVHGIQLRLQVAQGTQLLDSWRHETRIFQNPVGDTHLLRDQCIVLQKQRRARARQIIELTARGCGGNTLFD